MSRLVRDDRRRRCARHGMLPATALAALTALAFLGAAAAPAASASIWTASSLARVMPGTPAGSAQTIDVSAAGNEYEGAIIGLRGGANPHDVSVTWSPGSDPLLMQNAQLDQVMFVKVSRPTTHTGKKAGLYPATRWFLGPSASSSLCPRTARRCMCSFTYRTALRPARTTAPCT